VQAPGSCRLWARFCVPYIASNPGSLILALLHQPGTCPIKFPVVTCYLRKTRALGQPDRPLGPMLAPVANIGPRVSSTDHHLSWRRDYLQPACILRNQSTKDESLSLRHKPEFLGSLESLDPTKVPILLYSNLHGSCRVASQKHGYVLSVEAVAYTSGSNQRLTSVHSYWAMLVLRNRVPATSAEDFFVLVLEKSMSTRCRVTKLLCHYQHFPPTRG